jgi:exodeoxyribonuclease-3
MNNTVTMISWNVNGLRAILKKNFYDFVRQHNPDILCLQETKMGSEEVSIDMPEHTFYWNHAVKPGYSGTAIFTRYQPLSVKNGIGIEKHDQEGRVITMEFPQFYLVNVYTPNAQTELQRLDYRAKSWEADFLAYLKNLEKTKPVIVCGDLNVAHKEIDLARPKENVGSPGFTKEERECFQNLIDADLLDTFREFHKEGDQYTWWSYRTNARGRNIGWRIDYFMISKALRESLLDASIQADVLGSDHCPVTAVFHSELVK